MVSISEMLGKAVVKEIKASSKLRGAVHYVAFPYQTKLPLDIFYCCNQDCTQDDCDSCTTEKQITCDDCSEDCKGEFNSCKGIVKKYSDHGHELASISSKTLSVNKTKSVPINAVQKVKLRPFLILSANTDLTKPLVYGAPIYSLKDKQLAKQSFMDMLIKQEIPTMFYIDKTTQGVSKPSYIDLGTIMPIGENLILDYKGFIEPKDMIIISSKVEFLLDLRQYKYLNDLEDLKKMKVKLETDLNNINRFIDELNQTKKDA